MSGQDVSGQGARKPVPKLEADPKAGNDGKPNSPGGTPRSPGAEVPSSGIANTQQPQEAPKAKGRWEDYLQDAPQVLPSLTGVHALDEPSAEPRGRTPSTAARPAAPTSPLPQGTIQVQKGPFEVGPGLERRLPPEDNAAVGWRMIAVLVLCFAWLVLSVLPGPAPGPMAQAESAAPLEEGQYGRFELPVETHLPVVWMIKRHGSLVAIMTPGWERQPEVEKVETLRTLQAVSGGAEEILLLNDRSDLLGELYNGRYHFYP